jgi:hypothetical protein
MRKKLYKIKEIRARNNDLWMKILEIAINCAPTRTKMVLRNIRKADKKISKLLGELEK